MRKMTLAFSFCLVTVLCTQNVSFASTYDVSENDTEIRLVKGEFEDVATFLVEQYSLVSFSFRMAKFITPSITDFLVMDTLAPTSPFTETIGADGSYTYEGTVLAGNYDFVISGKGNWTWKDLGLYASSSVVTVIPAAIPLPASLWLLLSAFLGFSMIGRRSVPTPAQA
jgi:hypothetical protein